MDGGPWSIDDYARIDKSQVSENIICTPRIHDPPTTTDGLRLHDLLWYVESAIECLNGPDKHLVNWKGNDYLIARFGPFEIRNWHKQSGEPGMNIGQTKEMSHR